MVHSGGPFCFYREEKYVLLEGTSPGGSVWSDSEEGFEDEPVIFTLRNRSTKLCLQEKVLH
jgi:hypothetical protein